MILIKNFKADDQCRERQERRSYRTEFARFVFFGALRTLVAYAIYLVLLWFLSYALAYTISYAAGIFISYWINARFVFGEQLRLSRALQYPLVYLFQYLLGLALLYLLVEIANLPESVSPLLIIVVTVPATFLLSRFLLKRPFPGTQRPRIFSTSEEVSD